MILSRDAPIIGIGRLVCWYEPIFIYTVGKYKFLNMTVASISGKSGCIL